MTLFGQVLVFDTISDERTRQDPREDFSRRADTASSCFHAVHELDQTRCVFLGAYVIFEIGNSEDQAVAPALAIEADKSRIPAESSLMPLIGQRVGVFLASRVQEKHTDDRHSQYVPAGKTNDGKRSPRSEGVACKRRCGTPAVPSPAIHERAFAAVCSPGARATGRRRWSRVMRSTCLE